MPFQLKANPQFVEPLLCNLRNLVGAYWRDAVEALYPGFGEDYQPFAMIEFARRYDLEYPFLAIAPRRSNVPEGADGALIDGTYVIVFEFVVKHPNSVQAVLRGVRYARVLHCLVSSVTVAEMTDGIATGARAPVFWEVTDHEFFPLRRISVTPDNYGENPSGDQVGDDDDDRPYVQIVQLSLTVKLMEKFYGTS